MRHEAGHPQPTRGWRCARSLLVLCVLALPQLRHAAAKSSDTNGNKAAGKGPWSGKRVRAKSETTIYWSPAAVRPRRAIVEEGSVVLLDGQQPKSGAGCRASWVSVAGGGFFP